jgi:hypothetical protein
MDGVELGAQDPVIVFVTTSEVVAYRLQLRFNQ